MAESASLSPSESPSLSPSASPSLSPSISPSASPSQVPTLAEDSTGSTYNRGDFTATNAFFWSSLDLSPYAGTDLGSTPYWIEVLDSAGKKATGYIGAVGAEETLGSELLTSWENTFSSYETFASSGKDITSAINTTSDAISRSNSLGLTSGELLKVVITWTNSGGGIPYLYYRGLWEIQVASGLNTLYRNTLLGTANTYFNFYNIAAANWSSVNSSKRVTDPPSTAVHIVSSLNGTTRDWVSIESGFDPNTIASWNIYTLVSPSMSPSKSPSASPSVSPSASPSISPSASVSPSRSPSASPSISPSASPSVSPSISPSISPSVSPSVSPITGGTFIIFRRRRR